MYDKENPRETNGQYCTDAKHRGILRYKHPISVITILIE